jgi:hypothetical protein
VEEEAVLILAEDLKWLVLGDLVVVEQEELVEFLEPQTQEVVVVVETAQSALNFLEVLVDQES